MTWLGPGETALAHLGTFALWGFFATMVMEFVLQAAQGLGLSRVSLPFMIGLLITPDRHRAQLAGFALHAVAGWGFAALYFAVFLTLGVASWWMGALLGLVHGLLMLVVFLPLLAWAHPRMATEYDGPTAHRRLEPPGFLGLNYGDGTPVAIVLGHLAYGIVLGTFYDWHRYIAHLVG